MKKNVRILLAALIVSLCMGGLTACGKTDSGQLESGKSLKEGDVAPDVGGVKGTVHLSGCQRDGSSVLYFISKTLF